ISILSLFLSGRPDCTSSVRTTRCLSARRNRLSGIGFSSRCFGSFFSCRFSCYFSHRFSHVYGFRSRTFLSSNRLFGCRYSFSCTSFLRRSGFDSRFLSSGSVLLCVCCRKCSQEQEEENQNQQALGSTHRLTPEDVVS